MTHDVTKTYRPTIVTLSAASPTTKNNVVDIPANSQSTQVASNRFDRIRAVAYQIGSALLAMAYGQSAHYTECYKLLSSAEPKDADDPRVDEVVKAIGNLTSENVNMPCDNDYHDRFLHLAIRNGWPLKVFKALLKQGADLSLQNGYEQTLLHCIEAKACSSEVLDQILQTSKIDINHQDIFGNTILHYLLLNGGNQDTILKLIAHKPDLSQKNNNKQTLLHCIGAKGCSSEVLDQILDSKIDINHQDKYGNTVLHYLLLNGGDQDTILKLIARKPDLSQKNKNKQTLLHCIGAKGCSSDVLDQILDSKIDINHQDTYGNTVLHYLLLNGGDQDTILKLIARKPDLSLENKHGQTVLHCIGAKEYSLDVLDQILDSKIDINHQDIYGNTVLHYLLLNGGDQDTILKLIARKPDLSLENKHGQTVLHCIGAKGYSLDVLDQILQTSKIDINHQDTYGNTILHYLLLNRGDQDTILGWIARGANLYLKNNASQTALQYAIEKQYLEKEILELQLEAQANDPNAPFHKTPIHFSIEDKSKIEQFKELFNVFRDKINNIDQKFHDGNTLLQFAINTNYAKNGNRNSDSIEFLLEENCRFDFSFKNLLLLRKCIKYTKNNEKYKNLVENLKNRMKSKDNMKYRAVPGFTFFVNLSIFFISSLGAKFF